MLLLLFLKGKTIGSEGENNSERNLTIGLLLGNFLGADERSHTFIFFRFYIQYLPKRLLKINWMNKDHFDYIFGVCCVSVAETCKSIFSSFLYKHLL